VKRIEACIRLGRLDCSRWSPCANKTDGKATINEIMVQRERSLEFRDTSLVLALKQQDPSKFGMSLREIRIELYRCLGKIVVGTGSAPGMIGLSRFNGWPVHSLPTLRRRPCERLRTAQGRCGSLLLHRKGLAPSTPWRSPGAIRNPPHLRTQVFVACELAMANSLQQTITSNFQTFARM
jgi:hypothetical protein